MKNTRKKSIRNIVQAVFFILISMIAVNKTLAISGINVPFLSEASLHTLCPFGGVVTLYNLATLGTFIQKIHAAALVLAAIFLILAILFGPVFCGWICPLGTMQEWIGKIGRKIFKRKFNHFLPPKWDRYLRYLRYGVLIWVVAVTARSGYLIFENVDPYYALFTFWSGEVSLLAVSILIVTLLLSLFVERPWCKYACPYGALLGLTNKIRIFQIRRSPSSCIGCNQCSNNCPMNIPVSQKETISDLQCISCYECTSERNCPRPNTVEILFTKQQKETIAKKVGMHL